MLRVFALIAYMFTLVSCGCLTIIAQPQRSLPIPSTEKTTIKGTKKSPVQNEPRVLSQEELEQEAKTNFAFSLVDSLADEAKKYDDRAASVRVQAKAADLLWEKDAERARTVFYRAWALAEKVEEEEQRSLAEKKRKALSGESQMGFIPLPSNLRGEILQIVGQRDKQLTEELLAKFKKKTQETADDEKDDDFDPTEPDLATARRLELALYLLENGETEKALAIADASLYRATTQGITFLIVLRSKLPEAADARYANLLRKSIFDSQSDATSVSLLLSYVFTPMVIVTTTQNGTLSRNLDANPAASAPPNNLKLDFLNAAAQILLRPIPPAQQDRTSAGRDGLYFTITRLLPLFQQFLPDRVPLLQSQLGVIAQNISRETQERTDYFAEAGFGSENPKPRSFEDLLNEADSSHNKNQADKLYARAASLAARREDLRARDLAGKISDTDLKSKVLAFVDFTLIQKSIEKKDVDRAVALLKKAQLQQLQKIWLMTEVADLFGKKREFDARSVLDEAERESRKASIEDSWKANALSAVANSYLNFDRLRGWQIAYDAVKAANSSKFFGDKSNLFVELQTGDSVYAIKLNAQSLNINALFAKLAFDNIYQAADLARSFSDDYQKALSLLATAGSQLKKRKSDKKRPTNQ